MIWKIINDVKKFLDKCKQDKINAYSAQTAFFIVVSLIPFIMLFASMLQYTPITESMLMKIYRQALPDYISPFLISITSEVYNRTVGVISITAIVAIWSASKGLHYLADGLNAVHDLEENRNWFVLRFWAIVYTLALLIVLVVTLVLIVFGNSLQELLVSNFPMITGVVNFISRFRELFAFSIMVAFFLLMYTVLPNKKLKIKKQLPGAILCAVAWYVFSFGLSIYVDYFNGFSMYGSLTTIVLMMLWLYFCIYIFMWCGEINLFLEYKLKNTNILQYHKKK